MTGSPARPPWVYVLWAGIAAAVVIFVWHPWTGSSIQQEAMTAQTALATADSDFSTCLGPFNPNALPSAATNSSCLVSYATAVHGIIWPNETTTSDANTVINDADTLAGIYNSGQQPTEAVSGQFADDRVALSTAITDTISAAGG
jgi:hypothetical protein